MTAERARSGAVSTPVPSSNGLRYEHLDRAPGCTGLDEGFTAIVQSAQRAARDLRRIVKQSQDPRT